MYHKSLTSLRLVLGMTFTRLRDHILNVQFMSGAGNIMAKLKHRNFGASSSGTTSDIQRAFNDASSSSRGYQRHSSPNQHGDLATYEDTSVTSMACLLRRDQGEILMAAFCRIFGVWSSKAYSSTVCNSKATTKHIQKARHEQYAQLTGLLLSVIENGDAHGSFRSAGCHH